MGNDISCISSSLHISPDISCISSSFHQSPTAIGARVPPHLPRPRRRRPLITIVSPSHGRAIRFKEPLNVGELMLEVPGHFVAEFGRELKDGHDMLWSKRISALPGDRNLCAFHVYYLLPMNRLNTHLATHELRKIVMAAKLAPPASSAPYAPMNTSKITPLPSLQCKEAVMQHNIKKRHGELHRRQACTYRSHSLEKEKLQRDQMEKTGEGDGGEYYEQARLVKSTQRALSKARPWIPKLDTIMEPTLEP